MNFELFVISFFYHDRNEILLYCPLFSMAQVFFVDYGNTEEISTDRLKVLPLEVKDEPFLVSGFKPSFNHSFIKDLIVPFFH